MDIMFAGFYRTLFMYFFVLLALRLMGKREIGKLSIFDLVVSIMMAEIAVFIIEDPEMAISRAIVPILTLMLTQIILSYITLKSKKVRDLVEGEPAILIANGEIKDEEMRKQRYTIDDLITQLREKNIANIADVEFAILETSGKLSIFPKPSELPITKKDLGIDKEQYNGLPLPLVADGRVMSKNLKKIDKDYNWLNNQILMRGYDDIKEIYFASIDHNGSFYIDPKDVPDDKQSK